MGGYGGSSYGGAPYGGAPLSVAAPPADFSLLGEGESDASLDPTITALFILAGEGASDAVVAATTVIIVGVTDNRAGGRNRDGQGYASWLPPVTTIPAGPRSRVVAHAFSTPTYIGPGGTQPSYAVSSAWNDAPWDRIVVGGVDVTFFRGVATPFPGYELTEPLMYGSTSISFPQIAGAFETLGSGDLKWLRKGSPVYLQRVLGDTIRTDYRGILIDIDVVGNGVSIDVGGEATGRLALVNRQTPLWAAFQDIGRYAYSAMKEVGLRLRPYLGPTTGVRLQRFGGMSMLDYVSEILARSGTRDGNQWTIMPLPAFPDPYEGIYHMEEKDTTTINGTVYADDARTVIELHKAASEEPNRIFMTGVTPEGQRVRFGIYPGLKQTEAAPYPMDDNSSFGIGTEDADTDSGDGVTVMIQRLVVTKYLDQENMPGGYDSAVRKALMNLQEDMGRSFIDGVMDVQTWRALWDLDITGYSARWSHIEPAAQRRKVRKWNRSASGAIIGRNPHYNPSELLVDTNVDVGSGFTRDQMKEWAKTELLTEDNWVGTITFNTGALVAAEHTPGDPIETADVMYAREVRPGMNLWLPLFDGGTLVHVSGVSVDSDGNVQAAVDTRARDAMKVWEVITRNRESRNSPARAWRKDHRSSTMTKDSMGIWDEIGGQLYADIPMPGNQWTVFPVVAGQEGTVRNIDFKTAPFAEYVVAIFGKKISDKRLANLVGNPLTKKGSKRWVKESVRDTLDQSNYLLYVAGDYLNPCGYFPKQKQGGGDETTDTEDPEFEPAAPLTGRWKDEASFSYFTGEQPVLWVAMFPDRDTKIPRGRLMYNQIEAGN